MKSSKWMFGLLALTLIMAFSTSSFAQVQIQIFNTPSASEIQTNRNASSSDPLSTGAGLTISGSLVADAPLTATTLTLSFPAPITSGIPNSTVPPSDPIRIEGQSGVFAGITSLGVNYSNGTVTIVLPGTGGVPNTLSGSFRLVGVKFDANGKTAPVNVTASLSSSANNYLPPSNNSVPLVSAFGAGFTAAQGAVSGGTNLGTMLVFTNQTAGLFSAAQASVVLTEGFAFAWRTATQNTTNQTAAPNSTQIRVTVNGLPTGTTATISTASNNSNVTFSLSSTSLQPPNSSNPNRNTTVISFLGTRSGSTDAIQLDFNLTGNASGLTPGTITLTATMAPIGDALDANNQPTITGGFPRFAQADVGPITLGSILAANTTLLIPYAVRAGAYDTGIALANTTADPFASSGGGATPAAGTISVFLFPRTDTGAGTMRTFTTSATVRPGVGLATDGTLAAGGTWTALVTDLWTAAGQTGDFFGYIFFQTNFLNAHGAAYIFDGRGFTSGTPVLVLPPPATGQNSRNRGFEALDN
jgi:hypothetical protein